MKIERFRDRDNRILNRAADKKYEWLFTHCANGSCAVTTRLLNEHVTPMLFMHGVASVEIVDNT
jgi:hypothetical protein